MENIFFSVIIPTYNQANLLKKAISSVMKQSFENFELIIIDNYSNDESGKVVESFDTSKIIYKKIHNNGIIGKSRNEGIKLSSGKWVAFLDSDDSWYPKRLEIISNFLKKNKVYEVICTDELILDKIINKEKIWKYGPFVKNFYKNLLKNGNCVSTSATVVNKNFLKENNIIFNEEKNFVTAEDYDFFMNIAFNNANFKFLHEVLGEHLFYQQSQSSNYENHKSAVMSVVKYHVFSKQQFTSKKEKLWKDLKINFWFMDFFFNFKYKKNYIKSFLILIKIFLYFPIKFQVFILKKVKKKLFFNN